MHDLVHAGGLALVAVVSVLATIHPQSLLELLGPVRVTHLGAVPISDQRRPQVVDVLLHRGVDLNVDGEDVLRRAAILLLVQFRPTRGLRQHQPEALPGVVARRALHGYGDEGLHLLRLEHKLALGLLEVLARERGVALRGVTELDLPTTALPATDQDLMLAVLSGHVQRHGVFLEAENACLVIIDDGDDGLASRPQPRGDLVVARGRGDLAVARGIRERDVEVLILLVDGIVDDGDLNMLLALLGTKLEPAFHLDIVALVFRRSVFSLVVDPARLGDVPAARHLDDDLTGILEDRVLVDGELVDASVRIIVVRLLVREGHHLRRPEAHGGYPQHRLLHAHLQLFAAEHLTGGIHTILRPRHVRGLLNRQNSRDLLAGQVIAMLAADPGLRVSELLRSHILVH
mmetsp:Transcript_104110/g.299265  ORF Transcript_104110/g.299265 Transcript_104110/m.299265 type:complete len:403 (-) Transcript_104110:296-1504(-)